ncbi:MAG TPA: zf-HC2 domain-containing protein, partial [Kofleriaceae bacterium]
MAECDQLARTSAYFDGELPDAEIAAVLTHLPTCAECQRMLGAAVAVDAAVSSERSGQGARTVDELAARRSRRGVRVIAFVAVIAAAAALLFWFVRPKQTEPRVALALPAERAVSARFTGAAFMTHRPYAPLRSGDRAHEAIALETLAALEKKGDNRNLLAALASSGDVARAVQIAAKLPDDAATASDRAALALASRDFETALAHAYRAVDLDDKLVPAWWNLALVARELGLPRVAADAFKRVIAAGERGWSDEAKTELAAVARQIEAESSTDVDTRGRAMIDGGPALTADDVTRFPALTRIYFLDALRVATSKADVERLRLLAAALDQQSGTATAAAAVERSAAASFAARSKVAGKYRELVTRRMSAEDGAKLVDELKLLGAPVADLYFGAAVFLAQGKQRNAELRAIASGWKDPWFDLLLERDRIASTYPGDDLRAEPELAGVLASCTNPAWSLRCGQLAEALGALLLATGRIEEAEVRVR